MFLTVYGHKMGNTFEWGWATLRNFPGRCVASTPEIAYPTGYWHSGPGGNNKTCLSGIPEECSYTQVLTKHELGFMKVGYWYLRLTHADKEI